MFLLPLSSNIISFKERFSFLLKLNSIRFSGCKCTTFLFPHKPFWKKNNLVLKLFNIFGEKNIKLVGGAVRVALNNTKTKDLDFAVNIRPDLVKQKLEKNNIKFKDKSKGHGTISIFSKDYVIEITSLRKDIKTFGRKAKVGFVNSFEADAKRMRMHHPDVETPSEFSNKTGVNFKCGMVFLEAGRSYGQHGKDSNTR